MVGLTGRERRQLDELAGEIARDSPRLARALTGRWYSVRPRCGPRDGFGVRRDRPTRAWTGWTVILALAAAPLPIVGAVPTRPLLIGLGALAMVNGPALFTAVRVWRSRR
jgi:hypothetical protein